MKNEEGNQEDSEIVPEELDDSVVAEEHQGEQIKKLKEKLKAAEDKAKEYLDGWQRAQADFVNIRKRDEEAKVDFIKFANQRIFEELIPVLDSFNIALSHPDTKAKLGTGQEAINIEPIYKQLMSILKSNGLEELNPIGETFSTQEHEALSMTETDKEEEDHRIVEVMQKGYRLNGRVVRPAKVRVAQFISK